MCSRGQRLHRDPTWGSLELQPRTLIHPCRQAKLGVRQAGPGLLCVLWWGTQEAEGSGAPLETCL